MKIYKSHPKCKSFLSLSLRQTLFLLTLRKTVFLLKRCISFSQIYTETEWHKIGQNHL